METIQEDSNNFFIASMIPELQVVSIFLQLSFIRTAYCPFFSAINTHNKPQTIWKARRKDK